MSGPRSLLSTVAATYKAMMRSNWSIYRLPNACCGICLQRQLLLLHRGVIPLRTPVGVTCEWLNALANGMVGCARQATPLTLITATTEKNDGP